MLRFASALPAFFLAASGLVAAQSAPSLDPAKYVAVVVRVPAPSGFDRQKIVAYMSDLAPKFEQLPGLVQKYFTMSDDGTVGGIYLFRDRAAADAYITPQWRAGMRKQYGADANVLFFETPVQIVGHKPLGT